MNIASASVSRTAVMGTRVAPLFSGRVWDDVIVAGNSLDIVSILHSFKLKKANACSRISTMEEDMFPFLPKEEVHENMHLFDS